MEPRELALREVRDHPWLQQRELAARLAGQTGLAESTLIRLFRRMEADGQLRSGLDGRRKTYALPESVPTGPPSPGALWSSRLAPLGEREAETETEPEAETEQQPVRPEPAGTRRAWPIAGVVAAVLMVSVLAAVLLSPEKYDPLADDGDEQSKPVKASTPSSPPPKPKPKPETKRSPRRSRSPRQSPSRSPLPRRRRCASRC